ncbi:ribosome bioproteinis protein [Salix suchowensis]|nr:ribosome bioproteinis protein [Salix suchowensis]
MACWRYASRLQRTKRSTDGKQEETLEIEYIQSVMPPQWMSDIPHEDWVSSVSCGLQGFDTHCHFVARSNGPNFAHRLCCRPTARHPSPTYIPVSSIASSPSGKHLITASWDALIGVWDTSIPSSDEVAADQVQTERKSKKRKVDESDRPKRKAPVAVLKSHTARVSKAIFTGDKDALSCGFDSTVRTWDTEIGICTNTIVSAQCKYVAFVIDTLQIASEKPFLDLAVLQNGNTALAASADRTVTIYDLTADGASLSSTVGTLVHPATPSCIALSSSSSSSQQIATGSYDGVVRIWDLRSTKAAISSFKAWENKGRDGSRKILGLDWANGVIALVANVGLKFGEWTKGRHKEHKVLPSRAHRKYIGLIHLVMLRSSQIQYEYSGPQCLDLPFQDVRRLIQTQVYILGLSHLRLEGLLVLRSSPLSHRRRLMWVEASPLLHPRQRYCSVVRPVSILA